MTVLNSLGHRRDEIVDELVNTWFMFFELKSHSWIYCSKMSFSLVFVRNCIVKSEFCLWYLLQKGQSSFFFSFSGWYILIWVWQCCPRDPSLEQNMQNVISLWYAKEDAAGSCRQAFHKKYIQKMEFDLNVVWRELSRLGFQKQTLAVLRLTF